MFAPLIKWQHGHEWLVPNFEKMKIDSTSGEREIKINVKNIGGYHYITGHVIDGKINWLSSKTKISKILWVGGRISTT